MKFLFGELVTTTVGTVVNVVPIVAVIFGFQWLVLRKPIANLGAALRGFVFVILGLALFLVGLELALFPMGKVMAQQLTAPEFIREGTGHHLEGPIRWYDFGWVYLFAAAVGFATTIAEPALMAVAIKARSVSAGTVSVWGLRVAVAIGAATGISLGAFRIVTGTPLHYYIIAGYIVIVVQTMFAPRSIIALAYDSGGVTTSTVTVPMVAALGLGLAGSVPGRNPLIDGFGMIAFACLFPIMTVMGYAMIGRVLDRRLKRRR